MRLRGIRRLGCAAAVMAARCVAQAPDLFETKVRPLLASKCFGCHAEAQSGGLRLDTKEGFEHGGAHGAIVVAGKPQESRLIAALEYTNPKLKMPPGGKLTDAEIAAVSTWIAQDAKWPDGPTPTPPAAKYVITPEQRGFWSFQPVRHVESPAVQNRKWVQSPIDAFILAALEAKQIAPAAPADKRTLLRRATFDLTGLPPSAEEVTAFESDKRPGAFARVVDRLLASPRYGERWGRVWLDVARYSDDRLDSERDNPYESSFRYRDWVIDAIRNDMPYNQFVKAQIAGDLLPTDQREHSVAGLGFYAFSPEFQDDRVDATTRGFLGLTVACAQCHNHKYDPIPTQDYYSLLGIFRNTRCKEFPLDPAPVVQAFKEKKKALDDAEAESKEFAETQANQLAAIFASRTADYMMASRANAAPMEDLDAPTVERWRKYLQAPQKEHPYLASWFQAVQAGAPDIELRSIAEQFEKRVLESAVEKKRIDDENHIRLGLHPSREDKSQANLVSMERNQFVLWEDLYGEKGVVHYGSTEIARYLSGPWKQRFEALNARAIVAKKALPAKYAYVEGIEDEPKLTPQHVWLRGSETSPGELAPPHFLSILSPAEPQPFSAGAGRLGLAEAIVAKDNPLTARVIVNRVWQQHFGQGLVRTPSNFGLQGDRPSHPELLDYLASRFMDEGWSLKKLHREILLSSVYQTSSEASAAARAADPDNRLLSHFARRRLEIEALRDSMLLASGKLEERAGGSAQPLTLENHRRTVYGFVSRRRLDPLLALFDFPNPNNTSEQRLQTTVPLQKLFLMNSDFVTAQARAIVDLETGEEPGARVEAIYRRVLQRAPSDEEKKLALGFVDGSRESWARYAQVLLSSNEFSYLN